MRKIHEQPAQIYERRGAAIGEYARFSIGLAVGAAAYLACNLFKDEGISREEAEQLRDELDKRQAPDLRPGQEKAKWPPDDANDVLKGIEDLEEN